MNFFQKFKTFGKAFQHKAKFFYQNIFHKKKYLAIGFISLYVPFFIYYLKEEPKATTLLISKATQKLSDYQIPKFARNFVYGSYSRIYRVNQGQMIKKFQQYKTFSQFFTRKVKQRKIVKQLSAIYSPCDSKILSVGQIIEDSVFVIKGYNYSLGHLLTGQQIKFKKEDIQCIKKNKQSKLYQIVFYLAPGDYHRFHSVTSYEIMRRKAIEGSLFSVKQQNLIQRKKVYQKNSRLILHGKWQQGYLGMIMIGALNVGRIVVKDKILYQIGQQIGYFNLGSTVVLILESKNIQWSVKQDQKVKYGQIIGRCQNTEKQ